MTSPHSSGDAVEDCPRCLGQGAYLVACSKCGGAGKSPGAPCPEDVVKALVEAADTLERSVRGTINSDIRDAATDVRAAIAAVRRKP